MKKRTGEIWQVVIGVITALSGIIVAGNGNTSLGLFFILGGIAWFWGAMHAEHLV